MESKLMRVFIWLASCSMFTVSVASASELGSKSVNDKDLKTYVEYHEGFERFENDVSKRAKRDYEEKLAKKRDIYEKNQQVLAKKNLERLSESVRKYQKHLKEHPTAINRPFVMLNLAMVYVDIAKQKAMISAEHARDYYDKALLVLKDITSDFPRFTHYEQAMYLRATVFEEVGEKKGALKVWEKLAERGEGTIYGVHAKLAIGDEFFGKEKAETALRYYQMADSQLKKMGKSESSYDFVKTRYRIIWSAYRSAKVSLVLSTGEKLLTPGLKYPSESKRVQIQKDTVELIGDALYEQNNIRKTKLTLKNRKFSSFASEIGLRVLSRYSSHDIHDAVINLGEHLVKVYQATKELPQWYSLLARSYEIKKDLKKRAVALEKIALLLPKDSLWRGRHQKDFNAIKRMEDTAIKSARLAAAYYYDKGMSTGIKSYYYQASSMFNVLLDFLPNDEQSNRWRLKVAHCHFFSEELDRAEKEYIALKTEYNVNSDLLQVAGYQLVLTREKQWRYLFAKAVNRGMKPSSDNETMSKLQGLVSSINEFVNRFPSQSRSIDLLLVGGSAFRDHELYEKAENFWKRVLVSNPSISQRSVAIRGLISAMIKTGSSSDVVQLSRQFLRLENWGNLGEELRSELLGVLSQSVTDEGERLNKKGELKEAGSLMVGVATEFLMLPKRQLIYRDGAYFLAIAGDWSSALKAADSYLSLNLKEYRGDMIYLVAQANEYQIRLAKAASTYYKLAKNYPKHSRAMLALKKSENLSLAESDYRQAAMAASLYGDYSMRSETRFSSYKRAIGYSQMTEDTELTVNLAKKQYKNAKGVDQKLHARLDLAKANYAHGDEVAALDQYASIAKYTKRSKSMLSTKTYNSVYGEVMCLLGEESLRKFYDFSIIERSGGTIKNLKHKLGYFEEVSKNLSASIATSDPEWSTKSRYLFGKASEDFSDEISRSKTIEQDNLSPRDIDRLDKQIRKLRDLGKKYHSNNLIVQNKNPSRYRDNKWVARSSVRLNGYHKNDKKVRRTVVLPSAIHKSIPRQWSY